MNKRGQYSIIAALLVASILIGVVVTTYSLIRDFPMQEQTQTINAIEETNSAIKQLLWFTAGLYSSVLQVTGSRDYAYRTSYDYIINGTSYFSRMHPDWAISIVLKKLDLEIYWFTSKSYSKGEILVKYDLAGLGIYNITYSTSCKLDVTLIDVKEKTDRWDVRLNVSIDDGKEPFAALGIDNFRYYRYWQANTTWTREPPISVNFENGSYILALPKEIDPKAYLIQVQDHRGLTVVASSYSKCNIDITWESVLATGYKSISGLSDVDGSPDKGSHSSLPALKSKDGTFDILTESSGFLVKKGTFTKRSGTGTQTISGLGFKPKALIFWWTRQTSQGQSSSVSLGFGFATNRGGTYQNYGVAMAAQDNAGTSNTFRIRSESYSIIFLTFSGLGLAAQARVTSFTEDGFVLSWTTSDNYGYLIHYVALGGAEIVDAYAGSFSLTTGTGTQDVTVGFQPDFLMFLWTFYEDADNYADHAEIGLGFAASQAKRCAMVVCSEDGRDFTDTWQQLRTDSCILLLNQSTGNSYATVDFSQFLDNGFRINKITAPAASVPIFYLALKGGSYDLGSFNSPGSSTPTQEITVGFQPKLVMLASQGRASSPDVSSNAELAFGAAAPTSSGAIEKGAIWFEDPDNLGTSDNAMETLTNKIIQWRDRTSRDTFSLRGSANMAAFLSSGFRLSWSNFDSGKQIIYVAFGAKNHELDLEVQWTGIPNINITEAYLCIYANVSGATEPLNVDIWNNKTWTRAITGVSNGWNNITILQYLNSSTFTIRFKDNGTGLDGVQDSWKIDVALLRIMPSVDLYQLFRSETIVVELLQNGTVRWLGQTLLSPFTTPVPIPPLPVKAIRVNATINGVNRMIPFQIEEWASEFRVPLSLANNMSVFSDRNIIVFPINPNTTKVTIWWNGSDRAIQPYYESRFTTSSATNSRTISNGILDLKVDWSDGRFRAYSTVGGCTASTVFMRINNRDAHYGYSAPWIPVVGPVRAVLNHEVEWSGGVTNCPNFYAHIVLMLPVNATYYTYQLRLIFLQSSQPRTLSDVCLLSLSYSGGQPQTENGTLNGFPNASNSTGLFYNYSATCWQHHWSQLLDSSKTKGAGIMFTDASNKMLYRFNSIAGKSTGAVSVSSGKIEICPVTSLASASFTYPLDLAWYGAVVTFDNTTPIYDQKDMNGLWILSEYPPIAEISVDI